MNKKDQKEYEIFERDYAIKAHERNDAEITFLNEHTISISIVTLKSLLIINGGAAIAMLGFVSSLAGNTTQENALIVAMAIPISFFAKGVATSVFACCMAYVVMYLQVTHAQSMSYIWKHPYIEKGKKSDRIWYASTILQALTVIVAFGALAAFIMGIYAVNDAILTSKVVAE